GIFGNISILYVIFQVKGTKTYKDFFSPLDEKEYSYKSFLYGALAIIELLNIKGQGQYQAKLNQKIAMVYGKRKLSYYSKVHLSVKIFYIFLGIILSSLLCLLAKADFTGLIIILASGTGFFFLADKSLQDQYSKRKFQLERDFPHFLSKLILLMNAGLNIRQAISRIASDTTVNTQLYSELRAVITDIEAGLSENEAYSAFAERCKLKQISNFVSILQQNIKLGGNQILFELRRMNTECWEMRKNTARQLGETASSKLMFPLSIMLLAIIIICVAPVIIELGSVF
ncbi:MAG: type II secretion system F family protein, partial [Clostridiaceae bacterium]|nr:type II secretion system F family protein [Clostridiaceae bacterium]